MQFLFSATQAKQLPSAVVEDGLSLPVLKQEATTSFLAQVTQKCVILFFAILATKILGQILDIMAPEHLNLKYLQVEKLSIDP